MKFGSYSTFSFVDVETTGTSASHDRVLEIGIIRVENGNIVGEINTLIDSGAYIPPEITMITGISEKDVQNAPTFPDILDKVQELLADSVFVAHNARFDHAFIKHEFRRLGLPFSPKTLDTVRLARKLYPGFPRYNLDAIISLLGIKIKNRHRAYDDAYVLYELLKRVHREFPADFTNPIFTSFLKAPSLPTQIAKKQIDDLPDGPGVYIMRGTENSILYIGKSVDIKARVLSHFYNDFDSQTDLKLSSEVRSIDAIPKAGDLGASLLESKMIKEEGPLHNRALRQATGLLAIIQTEKEGYSTVNLLPVKDIAPKDHSKILGVFRSKKQAILYLQDKAKDYKLCLKLLGLEKGKGGCFGCQIEQCLGACTGLEPAFKYNVRFIEAFFDRRVKPWPYNGAIGIKEKFVSDLNRVDMEELHVVNNWCYLGSLTDKTNDIETIQSNEGSFDWDTYNIIKRFLKSHPHSIVNL